MISRPAGGDGLALVVLLVASALAVRRARRASAGAAVRARAANVEPAPWLAPLATRLTEPLLRGRRDRQVERALPDVLDAVARSLRSGSSLRQAVEETATAAEGPIADDLARVARALRDGDPLIGALERWGHDHPLPSVRLAIAALALGAETGGASAQAVDGVAATLRTNLAITGEVRALSSQARLSALVIVLAPIAFSFLAATTDGTTASFLLGTPFGLVCLALGLGLDAAGWLWMRRITTVVA